MLLLEADGEFCTVSTGLQVTKLECGVLVHGSPTPDFKLHSAITLRHPVCDYVIDFETLLLNIALNAHTVALLSLAILFHAYQYRQSLSLYLVVLYISAIDAHSFQ